MALQSEFKFNDMMSNESSIFKQTIGGSLSKRNRLLNFEIYVDENIGTQIIEISDKKQIGEAVERFAIKH